MEFLTLGHGTLEEPALAQLIAQARIAHLVDVRTVPRSRRHPWVARERLALWVPERTGARYSWAGALGGFRKTSSESVNTGLRNPSFRGYADYMRTLPFIEALASLLAEAARESTAIMCSETLWWRCHRRLIADAAVLLHGAEVRHLAANGTTRAHLPTPGARVDGVHLRYEAPAPSSIHGCAARAL